MATLLLSAAGGAIGAGFGGSVLGLSGAVIGRAVGATLGRVIDQRLLGSGSRAVETGRVDRFRLTGASEGAPVGQIWGRMRVSGQVIWASRFQEHVRKTGGGKGAPSPKVTEYSYTVNVAIALCEGVITRVGRIWADGGEISRSSLNLRVYRGTADQLPDPRIDAIEGVGNAPAYRGTAYVVIEDLDLAPYGNRVPQFSFEVVRPAQAQVADPVVDMTNGIKAVALIPGTGEYALATTPVHFAKGIGVNVSANVHRPGGRTDLDLAVEALAEELPNCRSVSLVVSWFGDDLRCGSCSIQPKVENRVLDGQGMPWTSGGISRAAAQTVPMIAGRPAYGGTPADASVVEAIAALKAAGQSVMFYPFVLMDQLPGNGLPDPWTGSVGQPSFPWRGRITTSLAPGISGSPDRTATSQAEVAAFFGTASPSHFTVSGTAVTYSGPPEWTYRRFILHYAALCKAAGGVDAFCIGSEMRSLTQVRAAGDVFPAVAAMRQLAGDVRAILGPSVKIGYAADWSEYWGYQDGQGNRYFHLDPLWADPNIDFVGIDNYMPLSDWRDGEHHADAAWESIYDIGYLQSGVEGGEGFDWYYAAPEHRAAQVRTPITDGDYGEPWVWRYKDIRNWWSNPHFERINGVRQAVGTAWVPEGKPIWFTEFGCPSVDKGTNEPNRFIDPKSSESALPYGSDGRRDDLIQMQYLRAVTDYWDDPARNPVSSVYGGQMLDMSRAHLWAWDTRPFPEFPVNSTVWSDAENYARGHWVSGRTTAQPLAAVVAEIAARSGLDAVDVDKLYGLVRGYGTADVGTGRSAIQPLMLAYGFDAMERDGSVQFRMRGLGQATVIDATALAVDDATNGSIETSRADASEVSGTVRLSYVEAEGDFAVRTAEAIFPDDDVSSSGVSDTNLSLLRPEAQGIAERWLAEARVARDSARFALPPSMAGIGAGDLVELPVSGGSAIYRIDRMEQAGALSLEAVRFERSVHARSDEAEDPVRPSSFVAPVPVSAVFLDLPLVTGQEVPYAPHIAVAAEPWPGPVAVYASDSDAGYVVNTTVTGAAIIGLTQTALAPATAGIWDRGDPLQVRFEVGAVASVLTQRLLNGANALAIGDGTPDRWEIMQFGQAALIAPKTFELSMRLRGQAGTEHVAPGGWPVGSLVVLLDGAPRQISLSLSERDLARHYRVGPARIDPSDPTYIHRVDAFPGIGLRPYAPCHFRASRQLNGDVDLTWVRRTRVGGDSWTGMDVPLGETNERYLLRLLSAAGLGFRQINVTSPGWTYSASDQVLDGAAVPFLAEVAQVSDVFGPGPFIRMSVDV